MSNDFHTCALQAGFIAFLEGRIDDSDYIKRMAYEFYELDRKIPLTPPTESGSDGDEYK